MTEPIRAKVNSISEFIPQKAPSTVDRELNPSTERFLGIDIEAESDHRYVIQYSSEPGKRIGD